MDELCKYLMKLLVMDVEGDTTLETINQMLVKDGSQASRDLRARLIAEKGTEQFLLVLLDCLRESIREGVNEDTIREQIGFYLDA
ncbi:MAG: hypothetical protein KC561_00525 [Myxococcales bacterium]|nr:hypothetical protein [Myxococcales bacterium]